MAMVTINDIVVIHVHAYEFITKLAIHFVPGMNSSSGDKSQSKSGVYLAVICSMAAILTLVLLGFILVRRRARRYRQSLSFVNKTFGVGNVTFTWI